MVFHCGQMLNKMFTLNNSRNLFFLTLWILSILLKVDGTVWNDITACYGADDDCSRYQMQCPAGTSIILGKLMYGTKWLQNCQYGISNCKEKDKVTACCGYNSSDTFTPFSQRNMSAIFENCEGKVSCEGWAPRLAKTPYSSYVWMQYACVNDNNRTDMCQNKTISGTDLFIRFNMSSSNLQISANTQKDCSCQILTPGCNVAMFTTLVDLDFNLPKLDTATAGCSTSSLEFVKQNKTYQCQNTELFKKGHTFERMTEINLHATNETVSMKNIIAANDLNGPNYIVLYFKTFPQQPLLVKCFAPGVEMSISKLECPITKVTTKSTSAQQITTKSSSSKLTSSFKASHHRTTPSVSMTTSPFQSSMSLNSVSSHSVTKNASSSFQTHTSNTPTTLESVISLTTLRSLPTLSSKNVSRPSTEQLTKQSATDFPSSYRPNLTPSVTRSRSYQPSVSPSVHSDSVPTSSSTIFASVNSESSSTNGIALRSTDTNSGLHSVSVDVTSSPTHTTTSTQTTIVPVLNTTSSKMYASSESTNKTISTDVETTNLVDQNSKNSLDISSINTEITTHSSAVTTRKTKDDDGNNNNGLIIGITVGMVILLMIIVAIITVLLCLRLRRSRKYSV
ncbi:mucin-3B-like isoform X2 [Ruditapes philippinarum]|uniref:mucin-3B-like isoform X2 n=1 Tax=Ruditapes philippinarum TaxID=129788 RepID=UPI00295C12CE|nr:mucin-3B-like isoform X2 [Ruditapes philippinarum]